MLNMSQSDCRNGGVAFAAGEDLSLKAGYLVKLDTGKDLVLPTSDRDITPYVVTHGADQGYLCGAVPLSSSMNCRVVLDGMCEAGTMLVAKGDGRVTAYTPGSAARVIGAAEERGVAGQHVLLRPVSVGVKGADGTNGAAGAAGAAGRDAGVLVIAKNSFASALADVPSHVGYIVWLVFVVDSYSWEATHGADSRDEAQYVIIAEDADTVTLFPMGGGSTATAAHTIALPMVLPLSTVLAWETAEVIPGLVLGPTASDGATSEYKVLTAASSSNSFVAQGCSYLTILTLSGGDAVVQFGGYVIGGT